MLRICTLWLGSTRCHDTWRHICCGCSDGLFSATLPAIMWIRCSCNTCAIADAEPGQVPGWSWGSAVLAATYRGLCQACLKTERTAVIIGCPLLLQLWSYERFAIARPLISEEPYPPEMYGMWDEDSPTMVSLWTSAGTSFARVRTSLFHALMTRSISTSRPSRTRIPRTVIRSTVARYVFRNLNYLIFFIKDR
jgi:hypothetical protein